MLSDAFDFRSSVAGAKGQTSPSLLTGVAFSAQTAPMH